MPPKQELAPTSHHWHFDAPVVINKIHTRCCRPLVTTSEGRNPTTTMLEQVATAQICVAPTLPNPNYLLGLFFILAQCFIWTAASVLTQYMFEETPVASPFLMTYVGVALMMLMFPVHWILEKWEAQKAQLSTPSHRDGHTNGPNGIEETDSFDEALGKATAYHKMVEVFATRSIENAKTTKKWNHRKHVLAALQ